jgi:hypothetical protein
MEQPIVIYTLYFISGILLGFVPHFFIGAVTDSRILARLQGFDFVENPIYTIHRWGIGIAILCGSLLGNYFSYKLLVRTSGN